MEVEFSKPLNDLEGHSIEIGGATWNSEHRSVRDRYPWSDGGFNVRGSSEVPMGDIMPMLEIVAEHDELSPKQCATIICALAESIVRQSS